MCVRFLHEDFPPSVWPPDPGQTLRAHQIEVTLAEKFGDVENRRKDLKKYERSLTPDGQVSIL